MQGVTENEYYSIYRIEFKLINRQIKNDRKDEIGKHIVSFILDDDIKSFEAIYKHYFTKILNFTLKYAAIKGFILIKADAEDILMEVYWTSWHERKKFRIVMPIDFKKVEEDFEDWLYFIARFRVKDGLKKLKPLPELVSLPEPVPLILDRDQIERVVNFLSPLKKDRERDILFFKYVIEMAYKWLIKVIEWACFTEKEHKDFIANFPDAKKILKPFITKENTRIYVNLGKIKAQGKDKDFGKAFDEIMKHEWLKNPTNLRKVTQRVCAMLESEMKKAECLRKNFKRAGDKIKKLITPDYQLSKKTLKRERKRLQDVCHRTCGILEKLRENLPDNSKKDNLLLDGYIKYLKLWMETLESW